MTYAPDVTYVHRRELRRSVAYAERVAYAFCVTYTPDVIYVCGVTYAGRDHAPCVTYAPDERGDETDSVRSSSPAGKYTPRPLTWLPTLAPRTP